MLYLCGQSHREEHQCYWKSHRYCCPLYIHVFNFDLWTSGPEENTGAEYRALRQLSETLLGAIRDPLTLAWKMYSKGLISRDVREQACKDSRSVEQQGSYLLSALKSKVASDETVFDTFVSILRDSEDQAMVEMYQTLKDARGMCVFFIRMIGKGVCVFFIMMIGKSMCVY